MRKWSVRKCNATWFAFDTFGMPAYRSPHWTSALAYALMGTDADRSGAKGRMTIHRLVEDLRRMMPDERQ